MGRSARLSTGTTSIVTQPVRGVATEPVLAQFWVWTEVGFRHLSLFGS